MTHIEQDGEKASRVSISSSPVQIYGRAPRRRRLERRDGARARPSSATSQLGARVWAPSSENVCAASHAKFVTVQVSTRSSTHSSACWWGVGTLNSLSGLFVDRLQCGWNSGGLGVWTPAAGYRQEGWMDKRYKSRRERDESNNAGAVEEGF